MRSRQNRFVTLWKRSLTLLLGGALLVIGVSFGRAIVNDDGLSFMGKAAAWARAHHLGVVVDVAESVWYRNPPDDSLDESSLTDAAPEAVSITPVDVRPARLTPVQPVALPGEGIWKVAATTDMKPVVWITSIRPSVKHRSMTATHMVIDQSALHAVLHNGTEIPGGRDWHFGPSLNSDESARAVTAFNGGFRKEHSGGGYFTEGREIWPLKRGVATYAIDAVGQLHVGVWGEDLDPAGHRGEAWKSVRQNLELLVIDGEPSPRLDEGYWGGGKKGEIYILRSGLCERFDGLLMFTIMGMTDATSLAHAMRDAGCRVAMQLDQNESYPRGYVFDNGIPSKIDRRMRGKTDDLLRGYSRDYVAFLRGTEPPHTPSP